MKKSHAKQSCEKDSNCFIVLVLGLETENVAKELGQVG